MDLEGFLLAFVPLFVIVDPLATLGLFLGLTARQDRRGRDLIAIRATVFATVVLLGFAFAGQAMLKTLGIELYSLRVAGGILLVLIGLSMLKEGEEVPVRELAEGELETDAQARQRGAPRHDPSFVPLGPPMLAGPGAISLVIVQGTTFDLATIGTAVGAAMALSLLVLMVAVRATRILGENARRVITRIMGLLTVAFAVQYVLDGLEGWLLAHELAGGEGSDVPA